MSNIRLDKVLVWDLEALCFATKEEQGDQTNDIIEIGACILDVHTGEILNKNRYVVRPQLLKVSEYCTKLTGHTIDTLKQGIPFVDAANKFVKEMGPKSKICAAYGDDEVAFEKECVKFGITSSLSGSYLNICHLFALKHKKTGRVGLEATLKMIGKEFVGIPHRADDDAWNAAVVLKSLL